MIAENASLCQ